MNVKAKDRMNFFIIVLYISMLSLLVTGCDSKLSHGNISIEDFSLSVLSAARRDDRNLLIDRLTSYSDSDLEWIRSQSGIVAGTVTNESSRRKDYAEDVKLWLNSYSDLFDLNFSSWSTKKIPSSRNTEVLSLIIWVEQDGEYRGILVSYVAKIRNEYKAIEWVELSGLEAHYEVNRKQAILVAHDASERKYPRNGIRYRTEMTGSGPDTFGGTPPGYSPLH